MMYDIILSDIIFVYYKIYIIFINIIISMYKCKHISWTILVYNFNNSHKVITLLAEIKGHKASRNSWMESIIIILPDVLKRQ